MFNKKATTKDSGFTLIELLVVISIIGLLSTIVLSSMDEARNRARNSAKNQLVQQYLNALELYRSDSDDGTYPASSTPEAYRCLGDYGGENCYGSYTQDQTLIEEISEYIPGAPADMTPIMMGTTNRRGLIYTCNLGSNCKNFTIRWILIGENQNCIESLLTTNSGGNTLCTYDSQLKLN